MSNHPDVKVCLPISAFRAATVEEATLHLLAGLYSRRRGPGIGLLALLNAENKELPQVYALRQDGAVQCLSEPPEPTDNMLEAQAHRLVLQMLNVDCHAQETEEQIGFWPYDKCEKLPCDLHVECLKIPLSSNMSGVLLLAKERPWKPKALQNMRIWTEAAGALLSDIQRRRQLEDMERRLSDITHCPPMEGFVQHEPFAAMGQQLANIAHELNNPLTSILGYSEHLMFQTSGEIWNVNMSEETAASIQECTRKIGRQAERARHIIRGLLDFAHTEPRALAPISLNELVCATEKLYADMLAAAGIDVQLRLKQNLPRIDGDASALQQVLGNLLSNARDAIKSHAVGGKITISTDISPSGDVVLSVEDDGRGILPEHLNRLTEPFFTTKQMGEGTGLGLSICSTILKAHKATLRVKSPPKSGAIFDVQFSPSTEVGEPLEMTPPFIKGGTTDMKRRETPLNIAVLDDEPMIRELLFENLGEQGNCVTCFDIPEALLMSLKSQRYDVILSDVKMPSMNGLEFYKSVEKLCSRQAKRIVFLSGDLMAAPLRRFLEQTGCLHLQKPFRQSVLLATIKELIHRGEASEFDADYIRALPLAA